MRCENCGSEISPDLVFCTNCGTLLGSRGTTGEFDVVGDGRSDTEVLNNGSSRFKDTVVEPVHLRAKEGRASSKERAASGYAADSNIPPSSTVRPVVTTHSMASVPTPAPSPGSSPNESNGSGEAKKNRTLVIALAVLAAVAVIALVVSLVVIFAGPKGEATHAGAASSAVSASGQSSASGSSSGEGNLDLNSHSGSEGSSSKSSDGMTSGGTPVVPAPGSSSPGSSSGLSDSEAYHILVESLADIRAYDSEVAQCSSDFNSNYARESMSTRSSEARAAANLKSEIKAKWESLKSVKMPFWSVNYDAWESMCELYECLWNRIDVIDRAWKVSLSYEKPSEHRDEICAPLKAAQDSSGQNKDYVKFKALLPTVRLVRP